MNKIKERLSLLKEWIKRGDWINPHNSSESNGYDTAVRQEIEFLESILPDLETIFEGAAYFGSVSVSRGPASDKWIKWRKTLQNYVSESLGDDYCED